MSVYSKQNKRSIPLKHRFIIGTIAERKGPDIVYVDLPDDYHWAKSARIPFEYFPENIEPRLLKVGEKLPIFIMQPLREEEGVYRANVAWGNPDNNPWLKDTPRKGELFNATAQSYLGTNGVFIEFDHPFASVSGIQSLVRLQEVPGSKKDIRTLIDVGDRLIVEVTDVRSEMLEVTSSIIKAINTLEAEEQSRRLQSAKRSMIELLAPRGWCEKQPLSGLSIALLLDNYFALHIKQWLTILGAHVLVCRNAEHLSVILHAPNAPKKLLCNPGQYGSSGPLKATIESQIAHLTLETIWISTQVSPLPFNAPVLTLPFELTKLLTLLLNKVYQDNVPKNTTPSFDDYQTQRVADLAEQRLKQWCEEYGLQGALWVVQERPGWFVARASHEIDEHLLRDIQPRLGQTIFDSTMANGVEEVQFVGQAGVLKSLAPSLSDQIYCLPIPFGFLEEEKQSNRAVAFFYRRQDYPNGPGDILRAHLGEMELIVEMRFFAQSNETLAALADLGKKSAAYLHEIGRQTELVKKQLPNDRNALKRISPTQWQKLNKSFVQLHQMARADLKAIQRHQAGDFNLRDRIVQLCEMYRVNFNDAQCSFHAELPDAPLHIALPALIIDLVVANLFDNALYFAKMLPTGMARISLTTSLDLTDLQRPLKLIIEDNGPGVQAGIKEYIFEPRYTDKGDEGTGLGLFISRGMIESIGGELVLLESTRWSCTRFCLSLPVKLDIK